MRTMTEEQWRVYNAILSRHKKGAEPPTIREIAKETGSAHSLAFRRVQALERKGFIERPNERDWRGIKLRVVID